jgi:hypothetical protein
MQPANNNCNCDLTALGKLLLDAGEAGEQLCSAIDRVVAAHEQGNTARLTNAIYTLEHLRNKLRGDTDAKEIPKRD